MGPLAEIEDEALVAATKGPVNPTLQRLLRYSNPCSGFKHGKVLIPERFCVSHSRLGVIDATSKAQTQSLLQGKAKPRCAWEARQLTCPTLTNMFASGNCVLDARTQGYSYRVETTRTINDLVD